MSYLTRIIETAPETADSEKRCIENALYVIFLKYFEKHKEH